MGYNKPPYYLTAYGLAVRQGFKGTLDQWLASLHGDGVQLRYQEGKLQCRNIKGVEELNPEEGWQDLLDVAGTQNEIFSKAQQEVLRVETAAAQAEEAAGRAEAAAEQIEVDQEFIATQVFAAGGSAEAAAGAAHDAAESKQNAKDAADRAEAAAKRAESAGGGGSGGTDVDIVQSTGDSETAVMSQKAATDSFVPSTFKVVEGVNLINPNKIIEGFYVNPSDGELLAHADQRVTPYIPVVGGAAYSLNNSARYAWYDNEKRYVSGGSAAFANNAPENACYIRIAMNKVVADSTMFTQTNTIPVQYIPYSVEIPELKVKPELSQEDLLIGGAYFTANIFNSADAVDGFYVAENTGANNANASYFASSFIKCKPNTTYTANLYSVRFVAYDENYCYLGGGKSYTYTTPENAVYLRLSHSISDKNRLVVIEGANMPTDYIPYGIVVPWLYTSTMGGKVSKYDGKKMVCFGDSITNAGYAGVITEETGIEAINMGMSSARYAYADDAGDAKNAFALYNIIDAVCTGNWTIPDSIRGVPGYEEQIAKIDALKTIDFNTVDFVSFAYGTNDYASATPIVDTDNLYDKNTVTGALRYAVKTLQTQYPHLRILVSLPIYRFFTTDGVVTSDGDTHDFGSGTLVEYCEAITEAARSVHVPVVDCYNNGGINAFNRLHYFSITDGTHPNAEGRAVIGRSIASGVLAYL